MNETPVLYSFRRCPYAMRARLAIAIAKTDVELREVVLRDKPPSMIEISPKATVPVLQLHDGTVIDESIDIMRWALAENDPANWLPKSDEETKLTNALIEEADGPFKKALDRYKYPSRYPEEGIVREEQRDIGVGIIQKWEERLSSSRFLLDDQPSLEDMAILPFLRQYAHVDKEWFDEQSFSNVQKWLQAFLESELFLSIMKKYDQWQEGTTGVPFPPKD